MDAEHVGRLVRKHLAASAEHESLRVGRRRLAVEARVVAREGVDADALAQQRLAEDEVPLGVGVQVGHGDTEEREGVVGEFFPQQ
jgi:hypothetical protein